jgi:hypothetical protein
MNVFVNLIKLIQGVKVGRRERENYFILKKTYFTI